MQRNFKETFVINQNFVLLPNGSVPKAFGITATSSTPSVRHNQLYIDSEI